MRRPLDARLFLRDEELDVGIALILGAERRLLEAVREVGRQEPLTEADVRLLLAVRQRPGLTVHALRAISGATVPTFARHLGRLSKLGLVQRHQTAEDGRERRVYLTEHGESTLRPAMDEMRAAMRDAYRAAGVEAVGGTRDVLGALARGRYG